MSELDRQVAEALGYKTEDYNGKLWVNSVEYSPSTNWEQFGKLMDEYRMNVIHGDKKVTVWIDDEIRYYSDAAESIRAAGCKALIRRYSGKG